MNITGTLIVGKGPGPMIFQPSDASEAEIKTGQSATRPNCAVERVQVRFRKRSFVQARSDVR